MAYERQVQGAMERLDQSLARLRQLIKRGENSVLRQQCCCRLSQNLVKEDSFMIKYYCIESNDDLHVLSRTHSRQSRPLPCNGFSLLPQLMDCLTDQWFIISSNQCHL